MAIMKNFNVPVLDTEEKITFSGIPDDLFESVMAEIDEALQQQMTENEIQESQSINFASGFITTL